MFGELATPIRSQNIDSPVGVTAQVDRPGEPLFQIFYYRGGDMISTDSTADRVPEVGLWVRSLLPVDPGLGSGSSIRATTDILNWSLG